MSFQVNPNDSFTPDNISINIPPSSGQSERDRQRCCADAVQKLLETLRRLEITSPIPLLSRRNGLPPIPEECSSNACNAACLNWLEMLWRYIYNQRDGNGDLKNKQALDAVSETLSNRCFPRNYPPSPPKPETRPLVLPDYKTIDPSQPDYKIIDPSQIGRLDCCSQSFNNLLVKLKELTGKSNIHDMETEWLHAPCTVQEVESGSCIPYSKRLELKRLTDGLDKNCQNTNPTGDPEIAGTLACQSKCKEYLEQLYSWYLNLPVEQQSRNHSEILRLIPEAYNNPCYNRSPVNTGDFVDTEGYWIDAPVQYRSITPDTLPDGLSVIEIIPINNPDSIRPTSDRVVPLGWEFRPEIYVREQVAKCCAELQRIKDAYRNQNPPIQGLQELDSNDCDFLDQVRAIVNRNPNGFAEQQLQRMANNCFTLWKWWTGQLLESGDPELPSAPGLQISPIVDRYNQFLKQLKEWWNTPEAQRNPKCPNGGVVHPSDIENGVVPYLPPPGISICDYTYCYALNGASAEDGPHGPLMPIFSQGWWQWWNTRQRDGKSLPVLNPKFMKKLLKSYPQFLGISCRLAGVLEFNPEQPCSVPADSGLSPTPGPNRLIRPGYGGDHGCSFYPHLFPSDGQDLTKNCMKVVVYYGGQQKVICVCKDGSPNPLIPGDPQLWREFEPPLPPTPDDGPGFTPTWAPEGCKCIDLPSPFPGIPGSGCPQPPEGYRSASLPLGRVPPFSFVNANSTIVLNSLAYISSNLWKSRQSRAKACAALTKAGELYTQYNTLLPSGIKSWPFNYSDKKIAGECGFNPPINGYDGVPLFNYGIDCVGGITDPRSHIKTVIDWVKCHRDAAANKKGVGGNVGRWNHILKQFEDLYNEGEGSSFIYRNASDASLVEYSSPEEGDIFTDSVAGVSDAVTQNCQSILERRLKTISYRLAIIKCLIQECFNKYYYSDCDNNGVCTTPRNFNSMSVEERSNRERELFECLNYFSQMLNYLLPAEVFGGGGEHLRRLFLELLGSYVYLPYNDRTIFNIRFYPPSCYPERLPCDGSSNSIERLRSISEWLDTIFGQIIPQFINGFAMKTPCSLYHILKSDSWGTSSFNNRFLAVGTQSIQGCLDSSGAENPYNLQPNQKMPPVPAGCIERMKELCDNYQNHPSHISKIIQCALDKLKTPQGLGLLSDELCFHNFIECDENGNPRMKSLQEIQDHLNKLFKKLLESCCRSISIQGRQAEEDRGVQNPDYQFGCCDYTCTEYCLASGCVDDPNTPSVQEDRVSCSTIVEYLMGNVSTTLPNCFPCVGARRPGRRMVSNSDSQDGGLPDPDTSGPGGPVFSDDAICGQLIISTTEIVENGLRRLRGNQSSGLPNDAPQIPPVPSFFNCKEAFEAIERIGDSLVWCHTGIPAYEARCRLHKAAIACYREMQRTGSMSLECYQKLEEYEKSIEDYRDGLLDQGAPPGVVLRGEAQYLLEAIRYILENCIALRKPIDP